MNPEHKAVRAIIRDMTVPEAEELLKRNLPERQYLAIYFHDVQQIDLLSVAEKIGCSESGVKKIRAAAYKKLAALFC